jgi:glutathione S-transferase
MCYHVSHERNVFPQLGIPSDEKVVAHALPKIEVALQVMERQLSHGQGFLLGGEMSLADYYLLPSTYAFGFAPEAKSMYADFPAIQEWRDGMEVLPTVQRCILIWLRPCTRTPRFARGAELGRVSPLGESAYPPNGVI